MQSIGIIYTVRDAKGKLSSFQVNVPSSTDLADVVDFATSLVPLALALITGGLVGVGISIDLGDILSPSDGTAAANSDVEEGAKFAYLTVEDNATGMRLPTFDEAKIVSGTRDVNQADADVIAWNLAILTGIAGVVPCDQRGEDIAGIDYQREQFLSS